MVQKKRKNQTRAITLKQAIANAKKALATANHNDNSVNSLIERSLAALRNHPVRFAATDSRLLPLPKSGGFLPLVPILTGLAALGTLAKTTSAVANAVKDVNDARKSFKSGSGLLNTKIGRGVYLKPYKNGLGLLISQPRTSAAESERRKKKKTNRSWTN